MKGEYPNLPLIEYIFLQHPDFKEAKQKRIERARSEKQTFIPFNVQAEVFLQSFPNTAGIFEDGKCVSGQAFTDQYITVMHELETNVHAVFGGNKPCYAVIDPPERFFQDIQAHHLATLAEAEVRY